MTSQDASPVPEVDSIEFVAADNVAEEARALARRVTTWKDDHVREYNPLVWADKEKRRIRRKAFAEASVYLHLLSNLGKLDWAPNLSDLIVEAVNQRDYFELVPREPELLLKYGYPFVFVYGQNELTPEAQDVLDQTVESRTPWARERVPHRQLDYFYFLRHLDYDFDALDPETIIEYSNARFQPDVVESTTRQVYALTHNVMYYTNFGIESEKFPDTVVPYDLETTLTGLTLRLMADNDTDAVVELLLTGVLQRQMAPSFVRFVFSWVREVSKGHDTVPGPGLQDLGASARDRVDPELASDSLGDWDDDTDEWVQHYHTAVAAGMCFNVLERDWETVVETAPTRDLDHEAHADDLLGLGEVLRRLSEYELAEAAPLLKDVAGTPAAEAYDDVLATATDFLERQRTYDGHVGYWTDERYLYVNGGHGDRDDFESDMMVPCTEKCNEALEAAGEVLETTSPATSVNDDD